MNPLEQRIAIAIALGFRWRIKDYGASNKQRVLTKGDEDGPAKMHEPLHWSWLDSVPDFLNDLNQMHEAEETMNADECVEYARQLMKHHPTYCVTVLEKGAELEDIAYQTWQVIHATAAQRAECFLRGKGLWKDSEK